MNDGTKSGERLINVLKKRVDRLRNQYNQAGADLAEDLTIHLKVEKTMDKSGNAVYSTVWVNKPKGMPKNTPSTLVDSHIDKLHEAQIPIIKDIFEEHEKAYKVHSERIAGEIIRRHSSEYVAERAGIYYSWLKNVEGITDEGRRQAFNLITTGIRNNDNPDTMIRGIREKVFGLKRGERNKGITYKATRLVRTEIAYSERAYDKEIIRRNPEFVGVRIRYFGGPCPSNICPDRLAWGTNVKHEGGEITADFLFYDGFNANDFLPPYHPNCFCVVVRYLTERYYKIQKLEYARIGVPFVKDTEIIVG